MHINNSKCLDGKRVFHAEATILDISDGDYYRKHKFQGGIVSTGRNHMGNRWWCLLPQA